MFPDFRGVFGFSYFVLSDLFSQFDPVGRVLYNIVALWGFWWINFYLIFLFCVVPVVMELGGCASLAFSFLVGFLGRFSEVGMWRFSGSSVFLVAVFVLILLVNWFGLLPGAFSLSRHFLFRVSYSFPM